MSEFEPLNMHLSLVGWLCSCEAQTSLAQTIPELSVFKEHERMLKTFRIYAKLNANTGGGWGAGGSYEAFHLK